MLLSAVRQRDAGTLQALLSQGSETGINGHTNSFAVEASPRGPGLPSPGGGSSLGRSPGAYFPGEKTKTRKAVDQNERDSSGNSALHLAVSLGSSGLVQTLLSLAPKLNVNLQDYESGYTALHKVFCIYIL